MCEQRKSCPEGYYLDFSFNLCIQIKSEVSDITNSTTTTNYTKNATNLTEFDDAKTALKT